jgi:hypothetical protein
MKAFTCELPVCCLDHRISFISVGSEKHCNFESSLTALAPLLLVRSGEEQRLLSTCLFMVVCECYRSLWQGLPW